MRYMKKTPRKSQKKDTDRNDKFEDHNSYDQSGLLDVHNNITNVK